MLVRSAGRPVSTGARTVNRGRLDPPLAIFMQTVCTVQADGSSLLDLSPNTVHAQLVESAQLNHPYLVSIEHTFKQVVCVKG